MKAAERRLRSLLSEFGRHLLYVWRPKESSVHHSPPHPDPIASPFSRLPTDCRAQRPHKRSTAETRGYNGSYTDASGLTVWYRTHFCEIAAERKAPRSQREN